MALLFLKWFYFYTVTFENLVSPSDLMLSHLFTTAGAPWVSMTLINGNSRLVAAGGSGYRKALEAEPHLQPNNHIMEQNGENKP